MEPDFGAFTDITSSPPRPLSYLAHRDRPPNAFHRSASNLSPVVEGNEDVDASGMRGSGGNVTLDPVRVIATKVVPSKTFLQLTQGGIFNPKSELEVSSDNSGDDESNLHQHEGITHVPSVSTPFIAEQNNSKTLLEVGDETGGPVFPTARSPSFQKKLTNPRSPLTRPKMRSNNLGGGQSKPASKQPGNVRRLTERTIDTKAIPAADQSVEQTVHRERVNSLMLPSKTVLRKISPPSVSPATLVSRKITPPSKTSNAGTRSPENRKIGAPHPPSPNCKTSATNAASQSEFFTVRTNPPPRKLSGVSRKISPPSLSPEEPTANVFSQRYRRKSITGISPSLAAVSDGPRSPARQAPPRRKISEPCFPSSFSPNSPAVSRRGGHP